MNNSKVTNMTDSEITTMANNMGHVSTSSNTQMDLNEISKNLESIVKDQLKAKEKVVSTAMAAILSNPTLTKSDGDIFDAPMKAIGCTEKLITHLKDIENLKSTITE